MHADLRSQDYPEDAPQDLTKWTVMVFMAADDPRGIADLGEEAASDLDEMVQAMRTPEKPGSAAIPSNVVVQLHHKGTVTREHIDSTGTRHELDTGKGDATDGTGLMSFIDTALSVSRHRPQDYSMLVLWGHAYQFAIGHAATRMGIDALDFAELADVLERFQIRHQEQRGLAQRPKLDIVAFDACDLATAEMAVQLQPFADYMLASQIGVPLPGWPYHRILGRLKVPEGRLMGPAELGTYVVRRFCEAYKAPSDAVEQGLIKGDDNARTVSLTLLDLRRARDLSELTETFARKLAIALGSADEHAVILELFRRSQTENGKPFVDVADLCLNLLLYCSDAAVRDAARALGDFLNSPQPIEEGGSEFGRGKPFVVEHGRNACRAARLHGLSLYAPHVSPGYESEKAEHFYEKFAMVKKSLWGQLVHTLAELE